MSDDNMRAEFEAWARRRWMGISRDGVKDLYDCDETESAWQAWQAAQQVPEGWKISRVPDDGVFPGGIKVDSPEDHHCILEKVGVRPPHHPINLFYDLCATLLNTQKPNQ